MDSIRFVLAYLMVFILGIFAVMGIESILFGPLTPKLIFAAILFAAPMVLVGATAAEIYYGFSRNATRVRFLLYGLIYGFLTTIVTISIVRIGPLGITLLVSLFGGIIGAALASIFYRIRGGSAGSGKAAR
ncbi:hypothetical protein [Listeria costaricensis]|uniref:hypothetical protein n=1 Tax=Listeria costaricensis TaxID=2026604 RepID=UPI001F09B5FD|nr:hypothetical protein [Listeria costaricensis]